MLLIERVVKLQLCELLALGVYGCCDRLSFCLWASLLSTCFLLRYQTIEEDFTCNFVPDVYSFPLLLVAVRGCDTQRCGEH